MDFDPISFDTDGTSNSPVTLLTHQLAAMEQFGDWQYGSSIFFHFILKPLAEHGGKSDLMRSHCTLVHLQPVKNKTKQTKKNNTTKGAGGQCPLVSFDSLARDSHK